MTRSPHARRSSESMTGEAVFPHIEDFAPDLETVLSSFHALTVQLSTNTEPTLDDIFCGYSHVNTLICNSARSRMYTLHALNKRLICRYAHGIGADLFLKLAIPTDSNDWKIADSFRRREFTSVDNTAEDGCKHEVASATQLKNSWIFPIMRPNSDDCFGIYCVDNPSAGLSDVDTRDAQRIIQDHLQLLTPLIQQAHELATEKDFLSSVDRKSVV